MMLHLIFDKIRWCLILIDIVTFYEDMPHYFCILLLLFPPTKIVMEDTQRREKNQKEKNEQTLVTAHIFTGGTKMLNIHTKPDIYVSLIFTQSLIHVILSLFLFVLILFTVKINLLWRHLLFIKK